MVRGSQPLSTRSERLMAPRDNAIDGSAILPPNDETITDLIHRQMPMSMPLRQQINRDRITDEFFNTVAHRTRAEFWMESSTHNKRQHRCVWFEFMSTVAQKVEFIFQEQLCDLQLVIVAEAVEDNLFCDTSKQFRAKRLLRTSQDVTLH